MTNEQLNKLIQDIKEQKIKINPWKGTILMDLLEHAQKLANQGHPEYQTMSKLLMLLINQPQPMNNLKAILC